MQRSQTQGKSSAFPEEVFPVLDPQRQSVLKKEKANSEAREHKSLAPVQEAGLSHQYNTEDTAQTNG